MSEYILKNNSFDKITIISYNKENVKYRDKCTPWCFRFDGMTKLL